MGALLSLFTWNLAECAAVFACSCCNFLLDQSLSSATKVGHLMIFLTTFVVAVVVGKGFFSQIEQYQTLAKVNITGGCDDRYIDECVYRQLMYRAGLAITAFSAFLGFVTYFSSYINKHFWLLKIILSIGIFVAFIWVENSQFQYWVAAASWLSFIWLTTQGLLFIDLSLDIQDYMSAIDENSNQTLGKMIYLGVSFICAVGGLTGIVYLFKDYSDCSIGKTNTIITLLMGVLTTVISLLDRVGQGLLTPSLIFAYSVFICWYALLSNPDQQCNPYAQKVHGPQDLATILIATLSLCVLVYASINTDKIISLFATERPTKPGYGAIGNSKKIELETFLNMSERSAITSQPAGRTESEPNAENTVQEESSIERSFYHILLALAGCYFTMILTSWGSPTGTPPSQTISSIGNEAMWLKFSSLYILFLVYARVLYVTYQNNTY